MEKCPEIDRWILSMLNSLVKEVGQAYELYEPTRAGRLIQDFVNENLSNWYVRLCRKRYWGGDYNVDKISAYQTLYKCLEKISILASPIAPFFMDRLFLDLNSVSGKFSETSVHLVDFPEVEEDLIDKALEERQDMAQKISSMALGLRRKVKIRVRQPLSKIMIPILDESIVPQLEAVKDIIISEINVKDIEFITDTTGILVKKIKPNFKTLGPKHGKIMKQIAAIVNQLNQEDIMKFEENSTFDITVNEQIVSLTLEDVEIVSEDIPGWLVANEGKLTIALDVSITEELRNEGIAREFINRIQNLRKDSGLEVTDKIKLSIGKHDYLNKAVEIHKDYIATQTLAESLELSDCLTEENAKLVEIDKGVESFIKIEKV